MVHTDRKVLRLGTVELILEVDREPVIHVSWEVEWITLCPSTLVEYGQGLVRSNGRIVSNDFDFEYIFVYNKPQRKLAKVIEVCMPTRCVQNTTSSVTKRRIGKKLPAAAEIELSAKL